MAITYDQFKILCPKNKNQKDTSDILNTMFLKYDINSKERMAGYLAQCIHESLQFTILKENLNYSADGLLKTFPKYFNVDSANKCARDPQRIANKVYSKRMGNGDEASGDGYKFRGRGCIQLTGANNYKAFAKSIGKSIDDIVTYCETLEGAIESSFWFWTANKINIFADNKDIIGMTKVVNGGIIGLSDRQEIYNNAMEILK